MKILKRKYKYSRRNNLKTLILFSCELQHLLANLDNQFHADYADEKCVVLLREFIMIFQSVQWHSTLNASIDEIREHLNVIHFDKGLLFQRYTHFLRPISTFIS